MSNVTQNNDVLPDERAKQEFAKMAQLIKSLEDEIRDLQVGLSRVKLRAQGLAVLATVRSLEL